MDLNQAIRARHAVRRHTDQPIDAATAQALREAIDQANAAGGLALQLVLDEPKAFAGLRAMGQFRGVRNYLAMVGPAGEAGAEACGRHGERVVLRAVQLGLGTCWVGLTYNKRAMPILIGPGQVLHAAVALGHAEGPAHSHKVKPIEALTSATPPFPDWFRRGLEAAQLGPSAMNQQRFRFDLDPETNSVSGRVGGPYGHIDLGIAKCHFEIGAGTEGWRWGP
ncbi:MAG: nitroreductase [Bifidobacteriaceae bacterium]|jgi:nitroreductase|nr:nitroreductase [Bifidobacteriaceae bacterium]